MLWGEAKLQVAENDSEGAKDPLALELFFGYETLLSGISMLRPK